MIDKIYRTVIIIGILCCVGKSYGQSPAVFPTAEPEKSVTIDRWEEASSYSIARRELEGELLHSISPRGKSDLMYQIIQISVEGKDYEEAYQWSTTFLTEFPYDRRKSKVLYFRGMCAYQTDRLDTALTQLNYYLINPGNNRRGDRKSVV